MRNQSQIVGKEINLTPPSIKAEMGSMKNKTLVRHILTILE